MLRGVEAHIGVPIEGKNPLATTYAAGNPTRAGGMGCRPAAWSGL